MVGNYDQQLRTTVKDISSLGKPRDRILETESTFSFTKIKCLEIILYVYEIISHCLRLF